METINRIFGGTRMTWKRVILISVITGIVVGALMVPAILEDTSFQDPGISFEFWILFALYIILNCEKPTEAGIKTFVAFLISQPIIYLVQVPFASLGWGLFGYYPYWFGLTILTLPGGMIAWFTKKGNWLSMAILSVANFILCMEIVYRTSDMAAAFPHHLLAEIFMFAEIIFFTLLILRKRKMRIAAFVIAAVMLVAAGFLQVQTQNGANTCSAEVEGTAPLTLTSEDSELYDVTFRDNWMDITYLPSRITEVGVDVITYTDADGKNYAVSVTYASDDYFLIGECEEVE